ncbi:MAG: hypothetical protein HLUCCA05_13125 [Roseibaca calidilacus]|uniref:RNA-binding protein n=1 Tax=Roseibaca calidilacus TaxID=1666912 RepID=A0A0P7WQ69_9RHOB|nr:DUF721 domain-containing protein [Roseibaca calidilacus]KPP92960.1 MAG: hypothetical protein HLUCCA05_13125 [Roseibaca calidilacus]CUX80371.1 hypothetical protein Ga0058931_1080 [Roseibaca calidilacus]
MPPPNSQMPPRKARGFQAASSLLGAQIRKVGEARGFAVSRLLTHWSEIAGPEIAACARPVKIGYAKGGFGATLTLLTTGPAAPMVQMQLPRLREKVNACYGYNAISRITITQTAPTGFAEGQAQFTPAPKPVPKAPAPQVVTQARAVTNDVADDALRAALECLATNVLSKHERTQGKTR